MSKKTKIVFISHDASVSGAPLLLLNLAALLKDSGKYNVSFIIKREGPLNSSFSDIGKSIFFKPKDYFQTNSISKKLIQFFKSRIQLGKIIMHCIAKDLIVSNTITNGRLLKIISTVNKSIITYVHELQFAAKQFDREFDCTYSIKCSKAFLYPSNAVADFLNVKYQVNQNVLFSLPYYFPWAGENDYDLTKVKSEFLSNYHIPSTDAIVISMGTISKRKGIDYFIDTAEIITKQNNNITFIWIGGFENEEIENLVKEKMKKINAKKIVFTGVLSHSYKNLLPADLFFLPSTEDPYPLVVLEAARLGIPSVCFEKSGGITDFVNDTTGWLVKNFSSHEAADIILKALLNTAILTEKGQQAKKMVIQKHYNTVLVQEHFDEIISAIV